MYNINIKRRFDMACYAPMNGKRITEFGSSTIKIYPEGSTAGDISIPCGKCIGCRLDYSLQWGVRCYLETLSWDHNYFITLTYSPENLPTTLTPTEDGLPVEIGNLISDHLKKFMKDLRSYYDYHFNHQNIRFFGSGEYGDKTYRPHFHIILFNLPIPDLKFYKKSWNGDNYYNSEILNNIWGKGHVVIGDVSYESAAYVARYVMKKQIGGGSLHSERVNREFVRMSRMPGIGRKYFEENYKIIYRDGSITIPTVNGIRAVKPPSYFDRLYETIDPDHLEAIKVRRRSHIDEKLKYITPAEMREALYRKGLEKKKIIQFVRDTDK